MAIKGVLKKTAVLATILGAMAVPGGTSAAARAHVATPSWLAEINRYRTATGDRPVVVQPAWEQGLRHHLTYLARTPQRYFVGQYQSWHTENPASPYYTPDGAREAGYSDLDEGATSALGAVDTWFRAPFHAIGMLRAGLTHLALAFDPRSTFAGLDVIQGLNGPPATKPVLFPGPGVVTNLRTFGGELPNPLETCGWQHRSAVGLPLIALLTQSPAAHLTATLRGPTGPESSTGRTLCVVDQNTFRTSDSVYGPNGLSILQGDHAVLVIPAKPLRRGRYTVTIKQTGRPAVSWSFLVS